MKKKENDTQPPLITEPATDRPKGMPTLAVLKTETARHGLPDSDAESLYDQWLVNGFRTKKGLIRNWKAYLRNCIRYGWLPSLSKKSREKDRRENMGAKLKRRGPQ